MLVDGSPGVGCPVIASLSGTDEVLLVAEPTISGLHDLVRISSLIRHFNLRAHLIINKADLNMEVSKMLIEEAEKQGFSMLGKIPYDPDVFKAIHNGKPLPVVSSGPASKALKEIFNKLEEVIR